MNRSVLILLVLILFMLPGCLDMFQEEETELEDAAREKELKDLSQPALDGDTSVEEAIYQRVSRRHFSETPLKKEQAAQLLWSAGGLGVDATTGPTRVAPSAGATHPMEIYLAAGQVEGLEPGVYRYFQEEQALKPVAEGDPREKLAEASQGQDFICDAPASIVVVAHYERTTADYGERGKRYVHMEAGNISQNIYLQAEALDLATVAVGAFDDDKVSELLREEGAPMVIMPVGDPS